MKIIKEVTSDQIETNLKNLGGGNHSDNMQQVNSYANCYLVDLTVEDFLNVVFLETNSTREMIQQAGSRNLKNVAIAANSLDGKNLGRNWNLSNVIALTNAALISGQGVFKQLPILLRPAKSDELKYGKWYLQDGSHRALGYAMRLLTDSAEYSNQQAYIVTNAKYNIGDVA